MDGKLSQTMFQEQQLLVVQRLSNNVIFYLFSPAKNLGVIKMIYYQSVLFRIKQLTEK
jgi:hypothetical protein